MADKKAYYKLDDIGFVGTQQKISAIQHKKVAKRTADIIRAKNAAKIFSIAHAKKKIVKSL